MHTRHGEQSATAMDILKWTWDFHRYPLEPKKVGFHVPQSSEVVEHISQWFKKSIEEYSTVIVKTLHNYITYVVEIPDKNVSIFFEFTLNPNTIPMLLVASRAHQTSFRVRGHV